MSVEDYNKCSHFSPHGGEMTEFLGPICEKHKTEVVEEWAEQGRGFQRWFNRLSDDALLQYFGMRKEEKGDNSGR